MLIKHYELTDRLSSVLLPESCMKISEISQFLFSVDTMAGKWHRISLDIRYWILDTRYWMLVFKSQIQNPKSDESEIPNPISEIKDLGYWHKIIKLSSRYKSYNIVREKHGRYPSIGK